jgi:glycosyltransferase involved in cell wall biosynthesis
MKVAYVVPRFGAQIVGGAEFGARMLAEHLVAATGWDVEAFTTCSVDHRTWDDVLPAATTEENGVVVHRLPSSAGRDAGFEPFSEVVLRHPSEASATDASRWIDLQGPVTPALLDAVEEAKPDVVVFYPYLYWPSVHGVPRFGRKSVLHPATHDEAPVRLPLFRSVFEGVGGLVYQTHGERRLTERFFPKTAGLPQAVVGLGVETAPGGSVPDAVAGRPFLLYVGRLDDGKGTGLLVRFFDEYKRRRPGRLTLVLAGPVVDRPVDHRDVVVLGPVDDDTKWALFRDAAVYVHPSPLESFSLVLLEAWSAGTPSMVNGRCEPTREHSRRSGGGLWFDGYGSFEAALDRLLGNPDLGAQMGKSGQAYVDRLYRWPRLMGRYQAFLEGIATRAG